MLNNSIVVPALARLETEYNHFDVDYPGLSSVVGQAAESTTISMDALYPTLIQCFAIITCGYLAGRLNIITNAESKGLNTFVGTFALPSLIFLSLVELEWSTVNWNFLLSILISKSIVFVAVVVISLLVVRPINYGKAGILAIFCTQSNDFAIGYPLVKVLYEKVHPEYAAYLYLMAPISLAILNPIGIILMEVTKLKRQKEQQQRQLNEEQLEGTANAADGAMAQIEPPQCPMRQSRSTGHRFALTGRSLMAVKFMQSVFYNPILMMTVLGVIGGLTFPNGLPTIISGVLQILGNSFSATALFLLGLRMVGNAHKLQGPGLILPGVLILVKLFVLPIVIRQTVNVIDAGANFTDTTDLSTFGFLYGTIPAAPGVFVFASQYNTEIDLIATSMVACTFISAPLMMVSAKMITLTNLNPNDYLHELVVVAFDVSIAAIMACVFLLLLFIVTKKIVRIPHKITSCLIITQLLGSVGVLLWSLELKEAPIWYSYLQFGLFTVGTYGSRLWTACLAISLLFLQCRSLCFVLKLWPYFVTIGWGLPTLIVALLFIFDAKSIQPTEMHNPSFQYGNAQAGIAIFILVMCFCSTVGCLVLHQRYRRRHEKYLTLSKEVSTPDLSSVSTTSTLAESNLMTSCSTANLIQSEPDVVSQAVTGAASSNCCSSEGGGCCSQNDTRTSSQATVLDIEDLIAGQNAGTPDTNALCSAQFNCGSSRRTCQTLVQQYQDRTTRTGLEPLELDDDNEDDHDTLKHTVLLILLLCSMFIGLALSVWTLVMEGMSGIYIELAFLDAFLNFGQSLIVFAVFIADFGDLFLPLRKYWRKIWYGANVLNLPNWEELSAETKGICDQFTTHHLSNCRKAIARDKRWRIRVYKNCFFGNQFVDWLIEVGLAHDRVEATKYAKHLVDGRVLRHINTALPFHDKNYLYTFCDRL